MNSYITIRPCTWQDDQQKLREIRQQVFVEEQQVPVELEWDGKDDSARHWLAEDEQGMAIGTVRLLQDGHIGRMAVLPPFRGNGVGMTLLNDVLAVAASEQLFEVYLYAQTSAIGFYEKAGFTVSGEEFMDAGIPHRRMYKQLQGERVLGQHHGRFAITDENKKFVINTMIEQCQRTLRILSYHLEPELFDDQALAQTLSKLARKNRYSEVKLLIVDSASVASANHELLALSRRLPTGIKIRKVNQEKETIPAYFVVADNCGVISDFEGTDKAGWADFNNKPVAESRIAEFEDMWQRSVADKQLQQLTI